MIVESSRMDYLCAVADLDIADVYFPSQLAILFVLETVLETHAHDRHQSYPLLAVRNWK